MDKLQIGDTVVAYSKGNEGMAEYTIDTASPKGDRVQDTSGSTPVIFLSQIHGGGRVKRLFVPKEEMAWEYFVEKTP